MRNNAQEKASAQKVNMQCTKYAHAACLQHAHEIIFRFDDSVCAYVERCVQWRGSAGNARNNSCLSGLLKTPIMWIRCGCFVDVLCVNVDLPPVETRNGKYDVFRASMADDSRRSFVGGYMVHILPSSSFLLSNVIHILTGAGVRHLAGKWWLSLCFS